MTPYEREVIARRRALQEIEDAHATEITRGYRAVRDRLGRDLSGLLSQIDQARLRGDRIKPTWIYRQERYRSLIEQLEERMGEWLGGAHAEIVDGQRDAISAAETDAEDLTVLAMGPAPDKAQAAVRTRFNSLPAMALDAMLGKTRDGRPLALLLLELVPAHVVAVRDALAYGVGSGRGTREIAADITEISRVPLTRALTIARTEVIDSYRDASDLAYRETRMIDEWEWFATLSERTCVVCLAMHGTRHPVGETLDSHPACRCTKLPVAPSYADLGYADIPDDRPRVETGEEAFERLSRAEQLAIVGPGKLELIEAGEVRLPDLVRFTQSARWARGRREATLAELVDAHR